MANVIANYVTAFEYAYAARPIPGELVCGDVPVICPHEDGLLLAAIDGVGHGEDAASAARVAAGVLQAHAADPVVTLVQRCHTQLRATRGVAMGIVSIDARSARLTWIGIGNVQGLLQHDGSERRHRLDVLLQRSGLVGSSLPPLQATTLPVVCGDLIALATDGVRDTFQQGLVEKGPPQRVADATLATHGRVTDDALVIVVQIVERRQ
jgi:phosphoserine phosphatase RsbX